MYTLIYLFLVDRQFCIQMGNQLRHTNMCLRVSLQVDLSRSNRVSVMITISCKAQLPDWLIPDALAEDKISLCLLNILLEIHFNVL